MNCLSKAVAISLEGFGGKGDGLTEEGVGFNSFPIKGLDYVPQA